jgi:hypothetical protein
MIGCVCKTNRCQNLKCSVNLWVKVGNCVKEWENKVYVKLFSLHTYTLQRNKIL